MSADSLSALSPTLNNYFFLRVELNPVSSLGMQVAEEAGLPSTEWEVCNWRGNAHVNSYISGWRFIFKAAGGGPIRREQRCSIAVFTCAENTNCVFQRASGNEPYTGTKDFRGRQFASC